MRTNLRLVAAAALAIAAWQSLAADVGRVVLAAGDTSALRQGQMVRLNYGSPVQDSDVLRTGPASNMQVRFDDDSYLSLRPGSEIRVQEFRYSGKEDGTERAVFNLLKGGMRAITGLVGRSNRENYTMQTPNATIGIRGTDYAATLCQGDCRNADGSLADNGLYGRVIGQSQGTNQIDVSNEAGRRTLGVNSNFYVAGPNSRIDLLLSLPDFVLSRLEGRGQGVARGAPGGTGSEHTTAGGAAEESRPSGTPPAVPQLQFVATQSLDARGTPAPLSEAAGTSSTSKFTGSIAFVLETATAAGAPGFPSGLVPFSSGIFTSFIGANSSLTGGIGGGTFAPGESGSLALADGGTMSWGRWIGPGLQLTDPANGITGMNQSAGLQFVVGSANTIMPTSGSFLYSYAGGPRPVDALGNTGTFNGGSFLVSFGANQLIATATPLSMTVNGATYSLSGGGATAGPSVLGGGLQLAGTCSGPCSVATGSAVATLVGPSAGGLAVAGSVSGGPATVIFSGAFKR